MKTQRLHEKVKAATEVDWDMEYLDLIISVKIVSSLDEALEHIARYSLAIQKLS